MQSIIFKEVRSRDYELNMEEQEQTTDLGFTMNDNYNVTSLSWLDVNGTTTTTNRTYLAINISDLLNTEPSSIIPILHFGQMFYGYVTPLILSIGIVGNGISLSVFLSKNLRSMSASRYLAALSTADICALIFYVLFEWLRRGLEHITTGQPVEFLAVEGICQLWLYLSYFSRFLSAWLTVCFTCERFIGVCMPLRRRSLGTLKDTNRIISVLVVVAAILVSYKPFMSEVHTIRNRTACTSRQNYKFESFVLDTIYGLLITLVPFLIISTLNFLIIRKLVLRNRFHQHHLFTEESHIRLEFTFILLAISFFFIVLNVPYFIVRFKLFLLHSDFIEKSVHTETPGNTSDHEFWRGLLFITRTIFYVNYCINFFLYSITGAYFRKELKRLFFSREPEYTLCNKLSHPTHETHIIQRNSWV